MPKLYYVIDGAENLTSYSAKTEAQEFFRSEGAAIARAKQLARSEPGKDFFVCVAIKVVQAGVKPVAVEGLK